MTTPTKRGLNLWKQPCGFPEALFSQGMLKDVDAFLRARTSPSSPTSSCDNEGIEQLSVAEHYLVPRVPFYFKCHETYLFPVHLAGGRKHR